MIALLFALMLPPSPDQLAFDVLVICPEAFDEAITPWVDYREAQGHSICLLRPKDPVEMKAAIRQVAGNGKLRYVVLVGDSPDRRVPEGQPLGKFETPTCYVKAKVNSRFGSEPWIATDNPFADIDDDGVPELFVGRLAVDSPEELTTVIKKVIAYESEPQHSEWRRKINLIAGVGGFGAVADSLLEMSTKRFIVDGIPCSYQATMTYGSWQSPYCPSPPRFRDQTIGRLNDGCLMWVYIGHGMPGYVAPVRTPRQYHPVLDVRDVRKLASREGAPIAVFFACYTAAFDLNRGGDCLAEEMLIQPKGPVAVLGATRVSMPYAMAVLSNSMLREFFSNKTSTLGELVTRSKRASVDQANDETDKARALLDALAASFSPTRNQLGDERMENVALFNLIGDPLLRLRYPQDMSLDFPESISAGDTVTIGGNVPYEGELLVEITYRRDRLLNPTPKRSEYSGTDAQLAEYDKTYAEANQRVVASKKIAVQEGSFEVELEIPEWARGAAYVRGFLESPDGYAMGGSEIKIRR